jgi:mitogen-activated protein kinase 15
MLNARSVFPGTCTLNQLNLIIQLTGYPNEDDIKDIGGSLTCLLENIKNGNYKNFSNVFVTASEDAIDLLKKLLVFNPKKRITIDDALSHPFFKDIRRIEEEICCESKIDYKISQTLKKEILEYKEKIGSYFQEFDEGKFITGGTIK